VGTGDDGAPLDILDIIGIEDEQECSELMEQLLTEWLKKRKR